MLAIVIFALSVTFCEIITFNLPKCSQFKSLTFKKQVMVMSCNVAEYVVGELFLWPTRWWKTDGFISSCFPLVHQRNTHTPHMVSLFDYPIWYHFFITPYGITFWLPHMVSLFDYLIGYHFLITPYGITFSLTHMISLFDYPIWNHFLITPHGITFWLPQWYHFLITHMVSLFDYPTG